MVRSLGSHGLILTGILQIKEQNVDRAIHHERGNIIMFAGSL